MSFIKPRTPRFYFRALLLAAACLFGAARADAAEQWLRLSSKHFDMLSCTGESDSRRVLAEMERFRMAFFTWFDERKMYYPRPLIFVFNSDAQFKPYNKMADGTTAHRGGVFMRSQLGPRIALPRGSSGRGMATVFHECAHSLVAASGLRLPLWLNEGVAEVFETFSTRGGEPVLGMRSNKHMRLLLGKKLIPMDEFFNATMQSPYYTEPERMRLFYAQAWLVTHYIMLGPRGRSQPAENLRKYIELYKKKRKPSEADFREAFGLGYAELERVLRAYVISDHNRHYSLRLPAASTRDGVTCRKAEMREVECELAALKIRMTHDHSERTIKRFERLVKKYEGDPRVWELYAGIAPRAKRNGHVEKAVDLGSRNPLARLWLLRERVNGIRWSLVNRLPDEDAAKLRQNAAAVLELEPDCMEAHALLATVESQCETMNDSALERAKAALADMNEAEYHQTQLAIAVACWRGGDNEQAREIAGQLLEEPGLSATIKLRATTLRNRIARSARKN
ncbi:hypothetical protein CKA38_01215 [Ereboglobus luteus]|uniref:DUF1570 domain-containing protein n=2 Tax=Ereboglobus luteus TaxID=1796921 RepID=A0A2U8DZN2_9BACT|nr:hypothetical protein CKA38_01215 [Ereboglobus luteus]